MKKAIFAVFVALSILGTTTAAQARTYTIRAAPNPTMRVMIGEASDINRFTANGDFVVENTKGKRFFELTPEDTVKVRYRDGKYLIWFRDEYRTSKTPVRITPTMHKDVVEVKTYENRPVWNSELNDNIFFGTIEVVYSEQSAQLLLVNDVGIERYIRGIAEAGNENDPDYLQALLTAARTYAWFNISYPTKHAGEPYILNATDGDQVYRGAGFTLRAPNIVAAQKATARQVITYEGEVIIAPYFSRSDGRTRSWSEVWYGDYPWAVSVEDPCCTAETLSGHGVGLSATGAVYFAAEGMLWQDILKYYYTGVEIESGY